MERKAMKKWGVLPRKPDFVIGDNYLLRWYILPRNPWLNVYLHKVQHDDDDRALHDHPWWNMSIILRGGYWEVTPGKTHNKPARRFRSAGSVVFRKASAAHRLEMGSAPTWTLFVTGPRIRDWGFHCPNGWRPWQQFVDQRDYGKAGQGCGEHDDV